MTFEIDASACFADRVGEAGLSADAFDPLLKTLAPAVARLARQRDSGELPILGLPARRDDLPRAREVAEMLSESCEVVAVLGTGGSSLGGQTLNALVDRGFGPPAGRPRLLFLDNIDPETFDPLLEAVAPERLGVVAISKSGGTAETLSQTLILLEHLKERLDESRLSAHLAVVTEPKDSPLKALAERYRLPCLDHDPGVGGRFSVLSNVGALPALLAGLDPVALREGAAEVLEATLAPNVLADAGPAVGAALSVGLARQGLSQSVLLSYADRLAVFGRWYRQLWAESLGKGGNGTTPIAAVGTVDQHSQLQLYLDGPADKLFTVLWLASAGSGGRVEAEEARALGLDYLAGRTMGDLFEAEARATADTLIANGRPTRLIRLERIDERVLGGLFMHYELETILAAELLGVDPFGQPAVEEGKVLARRYLAESPGAPAGPA
ncbi:MAG: glucose-6-phosphate isomerase [Tistlia sp.]|uniref:glucose-6-phosphate isomerase n=1 Tax=Tistlia sp. TaxID=3057121 RepID=UPI0034A5656A